MNKELKDKCMELIKDLKDSYLFCPRGILTTYIVSKEIIGVHNANDYLELCIVEFAKEYCKKVSKWMNW